jgi:hypothetical protein
MRRFLLVAAFVLLSIAGAVPRVFAQANVNESLETNFLYVDTVNGSDSNPCTQALPCKTISEAVSLATAIVGTTGSLIMVNPGTYRESITFANDRANYLPITVEAATNGTVTVSGADVWTGWQPYSGNSQIYTNTWPYDWGFCPMEVGDGAPYQTGLMLRREMVFMSGTPLTQVLSLGDMVYPDMFYVDETNGVIYVWPPSGVDINTATVEVSTRDPLVSVEDWNGLVFRGITFQYANSCHNDRAVFIEGSSSNILFDTDAFQWNNAKGVNFQAPFHNVTVENSNGLHNGQAGFLDFQGLYAEYTNDTANYNNWRGAEGSFYSWGRGGFYFDQDHYATVSNLTALYQSSNGYHWDTDNIQSTATNILAAGNMLNGIFYEKDPGPLTLTNSTIADNMYVPELVNDAGGGILFRNSEYLTLTNDEIFGNGNAQMYVTGQAGGIEVTDWQYGTEYNLVTSYLTFDGDVMESTSATPVGFSDFFLDGTDWTSFATTLSSNQNTWWNPSNTLDFELPFPSKNTYADFQTWQSDTGQDQNSTFQEPIPDPALTFVLPPPDYPDYWLAVDNSTLQVAAGGTAVFNLDTIPFGGFSSGVSLFLDGISEVPGLSGSLNTYSIPTPGTAQLSLSSLPTIAPGYYPITVVGNSGGTGNATKVVQFNVIIPGSGIHIVPATLIFPPTEDGYTSAPETSVATNYGTTPITISSIVVSGPFAEGNNCNGVVAANGGSCTLTVTFSPSITGVIPGTLTVTDSAPTSPQIITLSGTGVAAPPDFSLTVTPPTLTIMAGSSGTYTVTVASLNNFAGNISINCTGQVLATTCLPANATLSVTANSPATTTLTVTTTTGASFLPPAGGGVPWIPCVPRGTTSSVIGLVALMLWLLGTGKLRKSQTRTPQARRLAPATALGALLTIAGLLVACGGSSSTTSTSTPVMTYTLTVTATSGTNIHSMPVTLVVN